MNESPPHREHDPKRKVPSERFKMSEVHSELPENCAGVCAVPGPVIPKGYPTHKWYPGIT